MPFIVYKATNTVNGKVYVGCTRQKLAARRLPLGAEADLLRRYEAGETQAALARELGVSRAAITKAIGRARA